jgi:glutamine amidotransferase
VVDTGSGNLRSVHKALEAAGAQVTITSDSDLIRRADKVLVPGQGAFRSCMQGLACSGGELREVVLDAVARGVPYFGVCLGLQVLFEGSDESPEQPGLGLIKGRVVHFDLKPPLKVPHMGWNACVKGPAAAAAPALAQTPDGTSFYFVHSYFGMPQDPSVVALQSDHGTPFCAAVARDNIFACQFHPEKSQQAGLDLLRQFIAA